MQPEHAARFSPDERARLEAELTRLRRLFHLGVGRTMELRGLPDPDEMAVYRQRVRNQHVATLIEAREAWLHGAQVCPVWGEPIEHPVCRED